MAVSAWNRPRSRNNPYLNANAPYGASFTLGAETANTRNVAIQLTDRKGAAVAQRTMVDVYISDAATGVGLTATVPTSNLAVGTNGTIMATLTTNKHVKVLTDASGRVDINVIQTAVIATYRIVVVLPDGSLVISSALAFV